MSRRPILLLAVAVTLGLWLLSERLPQDGGTMTTPASATETLERRLAGNERLLASKGEIERAYVAAAIPYVERVAALAGFSLEPAHSGRIELETYIRDVFAELQFVALSRLDVQQIERKSPGITYYEVGISYVAGSDQEALSALMLLGLPERGLSWDRFLLVADREKRQVVVSGRLVAIAVASVE